MPASARIKAHAESSIDPVGRLLACGFLPAAPVHPARTHARSLDAGRSPGSRVVHRGSAFSSRSVGTMASGSRLTAYSCEGSRLSAVPVSALAGHRHLRRTIANPGRCATWSIRLGGGCVTSTACPSRSQGRRTHFGSAGHYRLGGATSLRWIEPGVTERADELQFPGAGPGDDEFHRWKRERCGSVPRHQAGDDPRAVVDAVRHADLSCAAIGHQGYHAAAACLPV